MHTLPLRVSIANTWRLLGRNDSRSLERWKTQAFFGMLVQPGRHDWYMMLDDDTLPNLASLTRILCLLHGDGDGAATRRRRTLAFGHNATGSKRVLSLRRGRVFSSTSRPWVGLGLRLEPRLDPNPLTITDPNPLTPTLTLTRASGRCSIE